MKFVLSLPTLIGDCANLFNRSTSPIEQTTPIKKYVESNVLISQRNATVEQLTNLMSCLRETLEETDLKKYSKEEVRSMLNYKKRLINHIVMIDEELYMRTLKEKLMSKL